ncbi:MAG: CesT family type III secretion system chaperone [Parachlamydiaceae bacterium]
MVSTQFGALLKEFESFFDCSLEPDNNNSCLIHLGNDINIQIEMDRDGCILIGSRLGAVHMGRYREVLIQQALKSNEVTLPSTGIFGFSHKSNQLILFMKLTPFNLNSSEISILLPPFIDKVKLWKEAIAKGEIPTIHSSISTKKPAGIFGLIS